MTACGSADIKWMERALSLAKKGEFTVRSNPLVGCVLVKDHTVVGEGLHWKQGGPHAEIHALSQAGEHAKGATCYVTLEPCAHTGKTGPCVEALIQAEIKEVIVAVRDPNPLVCGKGIAALKAAGLVVREGILAERAIALNKGFFTRMRHQRPYVRAKIAMSLDGRIAMKNGESQWITCPESRVDVHEWRAKSGVILTTGKTVRDDDCRLTPRGIKMELPSTIKFEPPLRMILDSHGSVTKEAAIFKEEGRVLRAALKNALPENEPDTMIFSNKDGHVNSEEVLAWMAQSEINDVWIEAGPTFLGAMLQAKCIDEWVVYIAPKWLGHEGMPMAYLPGLEKLSDHLKGHFSDVTRLGSDLRLIINLREDERELL